MTRERLFLAILVDIDDKSENEFNRWYNGKHLPEIVGCKGFVSGRRGVAIPAGQTPKYATLYEVENGQVLESDEVQAVRGWGPFVDRISNFQRLWFRTLGPKLIRNPDGTVRADDGS